MQGDGATAIMSNWSSLKREAATLEAYINGRLSSSSSSSSSASASATSAAAISVAVDGGGAELPSPLQQQHQHLLLQQQQGSGGGGSGGSGGTGASLSLSPYLERETARLREVDESIARLVAVVDKLVAIAAGSGQTAQLVAASTLQGVVHELRCEQRRQASALRAQREAAALMRRAGSGEGGGGGGSGGASATELLLRERGALQGSHSAVDDVLSRAAETQAALGRQRSAVLAASGRLGGIASRVPMLQDLMAAIQTRRSRNDYIVAAVIAACIVVSVLYVWPRGK